MTVKRDGAHYYACIAVRGLMPAEVHASEGVAVGIDMGVVNPLATSAGEFVTHHQGLEIRAHLARLERNKVRVKRKYARKLHAAAAGVGALTETGAFKKGVPVPTSKRMRRLLERQNKFDRQIVGYRADWQRNRALEIVGQSEIVVVEALTIKNMTASAAGTVEAPGRNVRAKAALNRAILARGFGTMRQRLRTKTEELCGRLVEVDPRCTSQSCPRCQHTDRGNRTTQAEFRCERCGYSEHADIVGAMNSRGSPRGRLHVNTSIAFAVHQLAPALPEFLNRYSDIQVDLSITDRVVDLVEEHADVTIRNGRIADMALAARKIGEFERVICAAPSYLSRYGVPRTPADLSNHVCIVMKTTPIRWPFRKRDGIDHVEVAPRVTTDNGEAALRLALDGAGIVRLSDMMLWQPVSRGLLVPLLTDAHHTEPLPVSALYLPGRHLLPKVRVFLDFLVERFGSAPWRIPEKSRRPPRAPQARKASIRAGSNNRAAAG
jgi:DNA-binding transcriptional LysR family regulator